MKIDKIIKKAKKLTQEDMRRISKRAKLLFTKQECLNLKGYSCICEECRKTSTYE